MGLLSFLAYTILGTMETYQGVKFAIRQLENACPDHPLLSRLNGWSYLFSQLGLAPVHSSGAYGNQSIRTSGNDFIITRSSMTPALALDKTNFTMVTGFDESAGEFLTKGKFPPSSECFLHHMIYQSDHTVGAILHGHSELLNRFAHELGIAVTDRFYDYGTRELADSALEVMSKGHRFFILRDHGFVAVGPTLDQAGDLSIDTYSALLTLVKTSRF